MIGPAIRVENLGKRYRMGQREPYRTLRDVLSNVACAHTRHRRPTGGAPERGQPDSGNGHVWALREVSFQVAQGELLGIIGRNGAGKTTLLKILARITEPTEGQARIRGRVGPLLEVGTGFHPELTGRENIYLNGAILGMTKAEITRKFDEIVAFAEVGQFIDTPVKRYSSGMFMRLAFSVAAHLEPEILLVDEVLAVGDAAFQKKCIGKMSDVAREGRTVIFVSHNMGAITRLCERGIWLDNGAVRLTGPTEEVVAQYLSLGESGKAEFSASPSATLGNDSFALRAVRVRNDRGLIVSTIDVRQSFFVEIEYELAQPMPGLRVGFRLLARDGTVVFSSTDRDGDALQDVHRSPGIFLSRCEIPGEFLNKGQYAVSVGIDIPMVQSILFVDNAVSFFVEATGSVVGSIADNRLGVVCPLLPWTVEPVTV